MEHPNVASDKVFAGSIPEIYDRFLVPLIFELYAADLAAWVAMVRPRDVLETAAGTGVLTRALVSQLAHSTCIVATSTRRCWSGHRADRQMVDVVACQFGVMFFPDKVRGYAAAPRVLRPGGRFLFIVWDRIEETEFADVVTAALAEAFPTDPPRFLARTPHGHHDVGMIREDLTAVGFAGISVGTVDATAGHPAPASGGPLLPGNAAAQRDRGARSLTPVRGREPSH